MKFDVLFSFGLGKNRGSAEIALPSTGTTNPMASSHSVVAEPGSIPDLVRATRLIHETSLILTPRAAQAERLPEGGEAGTMWLADALKRMEVSGGELLLCGRQPLSRSSFELSA